MLIEAFLDFIYYVIPYTFALFLTMPFTVKKAIIVASKDIKNSVFDWLNNV